eukprot:1018874-Rhodomonas_salina.1
MTNWESTNSHGSISSSTRAFSMMYLHHSERLSACGGMSALGVRMTSVGLSVSHTASTSPRESLWLASTVW